MRKSTSRVKTYPADGKHGVVSVDFLGPLVSTAAVGQEDQDANEKRETSHGKRQLLWPRRLVRVGSPWGHAALRRERLGGVEDGERGGQHGEDDERTAEANPTKCELGHADTSLDFLSGRLAF